MASFLTIFSLLLLLLLLQSSLSLSSTLFLPLIKDPNTNQYLTRIFHGSQHSSFVVDLNSPLSWLHCSSHPSNRTKLNCRSIQCTSAAPNPCPSPSSSSEQPCSLLLQNPINGVSATGELVEGTVSFHDQQISSVDSFLFSCAPSILLSGLPVGSKGVIGLGRSRTGAISQISHSFDHPKKFYLCLSSKKGMISSGTQETDAFKSMIYTPLLNNNNGDSSSYIINLKAVKIENKKLPSLNDLSSIKISTIDPYTKMETRVYKEFVKGFADAAESLNLERVPPTGGFEVCYGVKRSSGRIPMVDLVLQSEMVKWRIHGKNSMVKMTNEGEGEREGEGEVMCLGFIDGGVKLEGGVSMILGSYQMEDNLMEFDLVSSMLGFSSSLLNLDTSCSNLSFSAFNNKGVHTF